jgi:hypothetical protein
VPRIDAGTKGFDRPADNVINGRSETALACANAQNMLIETAKIAKVDCLFIAIFLAEKG